MGWVNPRLSKKSKIIALTKSKIIDGVSILGQDPPPPPTSKYYQPHRSSGASSQAPGPSGSQAGVACEALAGSQVKSGGWPVKVHCCCRWPEN